MTSNRYYRAEIPDDLLETQSPALRVFLRRFVRIVIEAIDEISAEKSLPHANDIDRPHRVFCIDGGRGSGKTYTLLSIDHALRQLTEYLHDRTGDQWTQYFYHEGFDDQLKRGRARLGVPQKSLAHTLKIIFPGDMEGEESLMEAIFAAMRDNLRAEEESAEDDGRRKKAKELADKLRESVAEGWYFVRRFGHEAIIRDSVDYRDFVERFENESGKSASRIDRWRTFVREYLDFNHAVILVVLLDDSDVQPELAQNILHAIRMFLNHPRVITVLAGNIRAMRASLIHLAMRRISSSSGALSAEDRRTAQDWRRTERRAIEEYLEKVLPPSQRFFLTSPSLQPPKPSRIQGSLSEKSNQGDFEKIAKCKLQDIYQRRLTATRDDFLRTKFSLALRREVSFEDRPSPTQRRTIEDFLSWWLFANNYADRLAPRSARQIATLAHYFADEIQENASSARYSQSKPSVKRLAVMLHDVPDNFTVLQRLSDGDRSVNRWVRQQSVESIWVGQRMFKINGREVSEGSYSYEYLRYRFDIGLATPVRDNSEENISSGLLPQVRGRRHIRRFYQPRNMARQQRRYGVSKLIDHAAIPSNCAYFSDLAALPDVSLISQEEMEKGADLQHGEWEDQLAGRWVELLDEEQDEFLVRYFTEVVCQRLRGTGRASPAALMSALDPLSRGSELSHSFYENSVKWEIASFGQSFDPVLYSTALDILRSDNGVVDFEKIADKEKKDAVDQTMRMLALNAALVNDLRRAWHAVRIYEHSPKWMESAEAAGLAQEYEDGARLLSANQSRMQLLDRVRLQRILEKSEWTKTVLRMFRLAPLSTALRKHLAIDLIDGSHMRKLEDDLKKLFILHQADTRGYEKEDVTKSPPGEEDVDYGHWASRLRRIGRALTKEWPVYSDDDDFLERINLEGFVECEPNEKLLHDWQLDISSAPEKNMAEKSADSSKQARQAKLAREARQFAWFLSGLAPTLPAIIHANIMSRLYEAQTQLRIAGAGKDQKPEVHKVKADRIKELYEEVIEELKKWFELVGSLTICVRYVKIKCLHLFAKLFIDAALRGGTNDADHASFFQLCGAQVSNSEAAFKELEKAFGPQAGKHLSMMPDVAPSSLFGEQWMVDLVKHSKLRSLIDKSASEGKVAVPKDEAREVRGMLGEAEQWLWASNRLLRKLYTTVEADNIRTKKELQRLSKLTRSRYQAR